MNRGCGQPVTILQYATHQQVGTTISVRRLKFLVEHIDKL